MKVFEQQLKTPAAAAVGAAAAFLLQVEASSVSNVENVYISLGLVS